MTQRSKSSAPIDFADGHTPRPASDVLGNARSFGRGHESDILTECGICARRIPLLASADYQPSLPTEISFRLAAKTRRQVACAPSLYRKVRDREDAIANTRDACATQTIERGRKIEAHLEGRAPFPVAPQSFALQHLLSCHDRINRCKVV